VLSAAAGLEESYKLSPATAKFCRRNCWVFVTDCRKHRVLWYTRQQSSAK